MKAAAEAPGGDWTKLISNAVGQWIEYTTPNLPAGTYQFNMIYRTDPTRAIHNVAVDGALVGGTIDQYAPAPPTYVAALAVPVSFATAGPHAIRLTATGKDADSTSFEISAAQLIFTPQ